MRTIASVGASIAGVRDGVHANVAPPVPGEGSHKSARCPPPRRSCEREPSSSRPRRRRAREPDGGHHGDRPRGRRTRRRAGPAAARGHQGARRRLGHHTPVRDGRPPLARPGRRDLPRADVRLPDRPAARPRRLGPAPARRRERPDARHRTGLRRQRGGPDLGRGGPARARRGLPPPRAPGAAPASRSTSPTWRRRPRRPALRSSCGSSPAPRGCTASRSSAWTSRTTGARAGRTSSSAATSSSRACGAPACASRPARPTCAGRSRAPSPRTAPTPRGSTAPPPCPPDARPTEITTASRPSSRRSSTSTRGSCARSSSAARTRAASCRASRSPVTSNGDDGRPVFFLMGVHHAREWPSAEAAMEFAQLLVRERGDARIARILEGRRVVILPLVNPDGYVSSRNAFDPGDSLAGQDPNVTLVEAIAPPGGLFAYRRKNCNGEIFGPELPCELAWGVDPNRNYGNLWGGPGSSSDLTSQSYHGQDPRSEPEVQAVWDYARTHHVTTLMTPAQRRGARPAPAGAQRLRPRARRAAHEGDRRRDRRRRRLHVAVLVAALRHRRDDRGRHVRGDRRLRLHDRDGPAGRRLPHALRDRRGRRVDRAQPARQGARRAARGPAARGRGGRQQRRSRRPARHRTGREGAAPEEDLRDAHERVLPSTGSSRSSTPDCRRSA